MTIFMQLRVIALNADDVIGIYGPNKNQLPTRMRFLAPNAGAVFMADLREHVVVSDMFRSAEASLQARRERRGAQRPAYSGHNYGYSIDLDVDKTMRNLQIKTKRGLNDWMVTHGWFCHRRDHERGFEDWHYNYFGNEFDRYVKLTDSRTSFGLERKIQINYGPWWDNMSLADVQRCLAKIGLYHGEIDGKIGPLSREGLRAFGRAWLVDNATDLLSAMTIRTLAYVTADRVLA